MAWNVLDHDGNAILITTEETLSELVSAINERCLAAGVSLVQIAGSDVDPDHLYLIPVIDLAGAIDSKITELIPLYVDYTQADENGQYPSGFGAIPMWTEITILNNISSALSGTTSAEYSGAIVEVAGTFNSDLTGTPTSGMIALRNSDNQEEEFQYTNLIVSGLGNTVGTFTVSTTLSNSYDIGDFIKIKDRISGPLNITSEWILQVYRIINRLKWCKIGMGAVDREDRALDYPNWPDSVWEEGSFYEPRRVYGMIGGVNDTQIRQASKYTISKNTVDFSCSIDAYLLNIENLGGFEWDDEGRGYIRNEIRLIESFAEDALNPKTTAIQARFEDEPPQPPVLDQYKGWQSDPSGAGAVLKYDGPNGFEFID